jgi:hypothetical protein
MEPTTDLNEAVENPRSRRALLAGVVGGFGALLVSAAQRAMPAEAAVGDPIRIGQTNSAGSGTTELRANTTKPVFRAVQVGGGNGLRGEATTGRGVVGIGGSGGTGLWGYSPDHNGVFATSDHGFCVNARAVGSNSVGLFGDARGSNSRALVTAGPSDLNGTVNVNASLVFLETSGAAPSANRARLFARDDGLGKTQLCVQFATGGVQVIATEP